MQRIYSEKTNERISQQKLQARTLEDYLMNFGNVWWPSGKTWSNM